MTTENVLRIDPAKRREALAAHPELISAATMAGVPLGAAVYLARYVSKAALPFVDLDALLDGGSSSAAALVVKYPELVERMDLGRMSGSAWVELLSNCPQYADRLTDWSKFVWYEWRDLLRCQPQFQDHCDFAAIPIKYRAGFFKDVPSVLTAERLQLVTEEERLALYPLRPDLVTADALPALPIRTMVEVLRKRPELATAEALDRVNEVFWGGYPWSALLSEQPQLACYCSFEHFYPDDWARLLEVQPQFRAKCPLAPEAVRPRYIRHLYFSIKRA